MRKISLIIISLLIIHSVMVNAQLKTMPVWPDKIPGSKNSPEYIETSQKWGELLGITKVTIPTITVYLPEKGRSNGTAVVICPGGGYAGLAFDFEGTEIAKWLNGLGVAGIVLKYRLPDDSIMENKNIGPLQDVQEAIRIVRRNALALNINPSRVGVMGFSAGGHLASTASTHYNEKVYENDNTSARPDFSLLIYPVITMREDFTHNGSRENLLGKNPGELQIGLFSNDEQVTSDTPPAFLVHSTNDDVVPVQNSIRYLLALRKNNVSGELHIYETGGHGYSISQTKGTETSWPMVCEKWLKTKGLL